MAISLSKFFPKDTEYFYSFPEGQESNFFSNDPPWKEELYATRPLTCCGDDIKVVIFSSSTNNRAWHLLYDEIKTAKFNRKQIVMLPENISADIKGKRRTQLIKSALKKACTPKKLIMAQPFLDADLEDCFQISPSLSVWLNDKNNIPEYIPSDCYPRRFVTFPNGKALNAADCVFSLPCVIKVSSSASGDGVLICRKEEDFARAKKKFKSVRQTIFIEEYINYVHNIGIQFGISFDRRKPIKIIGVNEQITTEDGEYMGAIIDRQQRISGVEKIYKLLLDDILPAVRKKGWYGVGGFDVLIDQSGHFYFIDCNFRITAMTAYMYQIKNHEIKNSVASFTGTFRGSEEDFRKTILPIAVQSDNKQRIKIITLSEKDGTYRFNACLFFRQRKNIPKLAKELLRLGIKSEVLKRFSNFKDF